MSGRAISKKPRLRHYLIGAGVALILIVIIAVATAPKAKTSPAAAAKTTAAATSSPASQPPAASPTADPGSVFADQMAAAGFFPGTQPDLVDADADAVCGDLQTESVAADIAYEESVDQNTLTGMTTKHDIVEFVTDAVNAYCPQYKSQLPAS